MKGDAKTEVKMEKLLKVQTSQKEMIEAMVNRLKKEPTTPRTHHYYKMALSELDEAWANFKTNHKKIIQSEDRTTLDENEYQTEDHYGFIQDLVLSTYDLLSTKLDENKPVDRKDDVSSLDVTQQQRGNNIRLPKITLDKFTGDYQTWPSFQDLFTSLIHDNESLSPVQKLQYLKLHVTGEPEKLLRNFLVTNNNYQVAWDTLKDRYENKRILVNTQLKKLLSQGVIQQERAQDLRRLLDTTNECLLALRNLKVDVSGWEPITIFITVQKLPSQTHQLWEQAMSKDKELPVWKDLEEFLENRFRALEAVSEKDKSPNTSKFRNTSTHHVSTVKRAGCVICSGEHVIWKCNKFLGLTSNQRVENIRNKGLCWNCLAQGHMSNKCPSAHRCHHCNKLHHTLLHLNPSTGNTQSQTPNRSSNHILNPETPAYQGAGDMVRSSNLGSYLTNGISQSHILLATARIKIEGPTGRKMEVRALIDQGSQASFITERIVQMLNLPKQQVSATIQGIGQERLHRINHKTRFTLGTINRDHTLTAEGFVMKRLTQILPSSRIKRVDWEHLNGLELADPQFYEPDQIDMLLGADVFSDIILEGVIKGKVGAPVAQRTMFGWILSGEIDTSKADNVINTFHINTCHIAEELKKFWTVEDLAYETKDQEGEDCERVYSETTIRKKDGTYVVELPLIKCSNKNYLGKSRDIALKRLHQLEYKFHNNQKFKSEYSKCINEYLELGHMVPVEPFELSDHVDGQTRYTSNYLPHHGVVKETSSTTKLRVVFDASRKTTSGKSLNDMMLKGPTIQSELPEILLRWRKHQIAFTADIEKMYRQIWVKEPHPEYQRIVWRANPSEPVKDYKLLTVTFGTKSAPYLAIRTLKQLALDGREKFPNAVKVVEEDFYVDDLLSGAETVEEGLNLQNELVNLMKEGGFTLRKWVSNRKELTENLASNMVEVQLPNLAEDIVVKTLGISWDPAKDTCGYTLNLDESSIIWTKRKVLSQIAKLFDPLGWISPVIVKAKIFMQKLWLDGLQWDDEVAIELRNEWGRYLSQLQELKDLKIFRWMNYSRSAKNIELHGFADASIQAYAAVVFICIENEDGKRICNMVMSKTKVAPIKTISLPRLELCAASLTAKLLRYVGKALNFHQTIKTFAWSDSEIVLAWLNDHPTRWTTFVANRVSHIHELLGSNCWRHVPSKENPADCASRGLSPKQLKEHDLWWHGPKWLKESISNWPTKRQHITVMEKRTIKVNNVQFQEVDFENMFSNLTRLIRVTAYCMRFYQNLQVSSNKRQRNYLKVNELQTALLTLVKRAQHRHFENEIKSLEKGETVSNKSNLIKLNPFLDQFGVLRVGGRLQHSSLSFDEKHPIILSDKDKLTILLIERTHKETLHGGCQLMMTVLRRKYWVLNSRNTIKSQIYRCVTCFKQRAMTRTQLMGDLPAYRTQVSRPFSHTGIDYCGPFELKTHKGRNTKKYKAYIAVFVCTTTKVIHLELVTELSADGFLAAFRRFCSRRGLCQEVYCDNGTNFVGASRIISKHHKQMMEEVNFEIAEIIENEGVKFNFIPPGSPHFGGLWEAGVKSTKFHLKRLLGNTILTYEEFTTVLCQVEACLNSRPLCEMSSDCEDLTPLTPAHFLIGDIMLTPPQPSYLDLKINTLDRWQYLQHLTQNFWKRWSLEYLNRLQQRPKWFKREKNVEIGELVLIKDENLPPGKWLLARIIATHPGADGLVRVVTVQTKNSVLKRPITKICTLPIKNTCESTNEQAHSKQIETKSS